MVSFTKSKRQSIQRDGRILRYLKNKVAEKYVFVIRDADDDDFFWILMKTNQIQPALMGSWLDYQNGSFVISNELKMRYRSLFSNHVVESSIGGLSKVL